MKIALLGSTGYVGSEFAKLIHTTPGIDLIPIHRSEHNILDPCELKTAFQKSNVDAVINCAGYTGKPNVDACETDKAACLAGNAVLPGSLATACHELDLPFGHVSSGCIYTGKKTDGRGFNEEDEPNFCFRTNNCSFYSGTKALGEEVLADAERCWIWRLRLPFSNVDSPRNYLSKLMRYDRLLDVENSLSNLTEMVRGCVDCITRALPFGTYNLTNPGSVTTRDVVQLIRESELVDREFHFFESEEEFMQMPGRAKRSNCLLDSGKAINAGLKLTPVTDSIRSSLRNWAA